MRNSDRRAACGSMFLLSAATLHPAQVSAGDLPASTSGAAAQLASPSSTAVGDTPRQLNPLVGLATIRPAEILDALDTCLEVVDGQAISSGAMHALGWLSVAGTGPGSLPGAAYYARPGGNLQIIVPQDGDNAKACTTIGIIGAASNKAIMEELATERLGPATQGVSPVSRAGDLNWTTPMASVVMDISPLARDGPYRAWVIVHPRDVHP